MRVTRLLKAIALTKTHGMRSVKWPRGVLWPEYYSEPQIRYSPIATSVG